MKVICAGLPKTGTKTLARALEILGYNNCDGFPQQFLTFYDEFYDLMYFAKIPDFKAMFKGIDSVTDLPASYFFGEILEAFPDAKVILSIREEESWLKSVRGQFKDAEIFNKRLSARFFRNLSPTCAKIYELGIGGAQASMGSFGPESSVVHRHHYRMHEARVKAAVPENQLLLYSVTQGWKPLCEFLGRDIPPVPFPHENIKGAILNTKEVRITGKNATERKIIMEALIRLAMIVGVLIIVIYTIIRL